MSSHAVALSTVGSADEAAKLARVLVEEGLAACVNLIPAVRSIYRWNGEICDHTEVLCVIKTTTERIDELTTRLIALHSYSTPELIVLPLTGGNPAYLAWVDEVCRRSP